MLLDRILARIALSLHRAAVPHRSLSGLSSWKKLPSLPAPGRHDHGMVVLSIGRQAGPAREAVAVFGGHFGHGKSMTTLDTWLYTSGAGWTEATATPGGAHIHIDPLGSAATATISFGISELVVQFGGFSDAGTLQDTLGLNLDLLEPGNAVTASWLLDAPGPDKLQPAKRSGATLVGLGENGYGVLFGGYGDANLADAYGLVLGAQGGFSWEPITPRQGDAPPARCAHTAVALGVGTMAVFGGYGDNGPLNDLWTLASYPGIGWMWARVDGISGDPPEARSGHSAVAIGDDKMLVFGGVGDKGKAHADLFLYTHSARRWDRLDPPTGDFAVTARYNHRAVVVNQGTRDAAMVVVGGFAKIPGSTGGAVATNDVFELPLAGI